MKFTSCIGVLAKNTKGDAVIVVHLVVLDKEGKPFAADDVSKVTIALKAAGYDDSTDDPGADQRLESISTSWLRGTGENSEPRDQFAFAQGTYGGKLDDDKAIEITAD